MDERMMKFRVGVVAGVTLFIAGVLVLVFGNFSLEDYFGGYYSIQIEFAEAPGVTDSTPVRKSGITIGRVTDVQLEPNGMVLVTVAIKKKYKLRQDEMPRIGGGSLFGDSVIEFVPRPKSKEPSNVVRPVSFLQKKPKPEFIQPGEKIRGGVARDPLTALSEMEDTLSAVGRSLGSASDKFGALADRVTQMLEQNKGQVTSFLNKAEKAMVGLESMARDVGELVKDPMLREKLNRSLDEMPKLMADATKTMREAQLAMQDIRQATALATRNLKNLEQFSEPLGQRGERLLIRADEMFTKLGRSSGDLELLLGNLLIFSNALKKKDGTLGKLLNDPELYDNLTDVTRNVNRLTLELRPILYDARFLADKISRDPSGQIGLRSVFEKHSEAKPVRRY